MVNDCLNKLNKTELSLYLNFMMKPIPFWRNTSSWSTHNAFSSFSLLSFFTKARTYLARADGSASHLQINWLGKKKKGNLITENYVWNWYDQYIYRAKPFPTKAIEKYSGVFFETVQIHNISNYHFPFQANNCLEYFLTILQRTSEQTRTNYFIRNSLNCQTALY